MQQDAYQISSVALAHTPFADIQTEEAAGKNHLPEMRISHGYCSDLHRKTAPLFNDRVYLIKKGGNVM
jgi:hypothetical protein